MEKKIKRNMHETEEKNNIIVEWEVVQMQFLYADESICSNKR